MNLNQIVNLVIRTVIMQTTRLLVNRVFGLFSRRGGSRPMPPLPSAEPVSGRVQGIPAADPATAVSDDPVAAARRLRREAALARRLSR